MIGENVIVRTFSAGVHIGTLVSMQDTHCLLSNARRLWRWRGANTLSEVSMHGVDHEYSRISGPVPQILLTQAIEVIPLSDVAAINLSKSRWPE